MPEHKKKERKQPERERGREREKKSVHLFHMENVRRWFDANFQIFTKDLIKWNDVYTVRIMKIQYIHIRSEKDRARGKRIKRKRGEKESDSLYYGSAFEFYESVGSESFVSDVYIWF